jgi:hypothetical protein
MVGDKAVRTPGGVAAIAAIFFFLSLIPSVMGGYALRTAFRDPRYRYLRNPGRFGIAAGKLTGMDRYSREGGYRVHGRFQAVSGEIRQFGESLGRTLGGRILARWDRVESPVEPDPEPAESDAFVIAEEREIRLREMPVWVLYSRDPSPSGPDDRVDDYVPAAALVGIPADIIARLGGG